MPVDSKLKEELLDFIANASVPARKWLKGKKLEFYVRKEFQKTGICLTVADCQIAGCWGSLEEVGEYGEIIEFIKFLHSVNPYDFTYVESIGRGLGQQLWEQNWLVAEQPACMLKRRNHGEIPMMV